MCNEVGAKPLRWCDHGDAASLACVWTYGVTSTGAKPASRKSADSFSTSASLAMTSS